MQTLFSKKWVEIMLSSILFGTLVAFLPDVFEGYAVAIVISVAVAIVVFVLVLLFLDKRRVCNHISEGEALELERKGIVFTLGYNSHLDGSPLIKAMKKIKQPACCAFLSTRETSAVVDAIVEKCGLAKDCFIENVIDETNIEQVREKTGESIDWLLKEKRIHRDKIVVDITGGTAIVSIGAYLGAAPKGVDTQYIYSKYKDNAPVPGTQKALLIKQV